MTLEGFMADLLLDILVLVSRSHAELLKCRCHDENDDSFKLKRYKIAVSSCVVHLAQTLHNDSGNADFV